MNPEPNETVPGTRKPRPLILEGPAATFNVVQYAIQAIGWASIGLAIGLWRSYHLDAAFAIFFGLISIAYGLRNMKWTRPLITYSETKAKAFREAKRMHPTYERAQLLQVASALMANPEMAPYYGGRTMEQIEAARKSVNDAPELQS